MWTNPITVWQVGMLDPPCRIPYSNFIWRVCRSPNTVLYSSLFLSALDDILAFQHVTMYQNCTLIDDWLPGTTWIQFLMSWPPQSWRSLFMIYKSISIANQADRVILSKSSCHYQHIVSFPQYRVILSRSSCLFQHILLSTSPLFQDEIRHHN